MKRLFVNLLACAFVPASFSQAPAQSTLWTADPPAVSSGALALMEKAQGHEEALGDQIQSAARPRTPLLSWLLSLVYPALGLSFEGINFNQNAANTGFLQIPPDPSGAAGPGHVVSVVNSSIQWFTKEGALQRNQSLRTFFAPLAPQTTTFDPKVVYDPHAGRFVVVTLERVGTANNDAANRSRIYLAVSDDSDPNGAWYFLEINSRVVIGAADRWADFPGLAVDEEAVYVTANMFSFATAPGFGGVRLWIIPKLPFYSGGAAAANIYDPVGLANVNPNGDGAVATTAQPTMMYGAPPAGLGTFLVQYGGLTNGVNAFLGVIRVDNPLTSPTFEGRFLNLGPFAGVDNLFLGFPGGPQLGTTRTIATNDRRVSQAPVWRNGNLYLAAPTVAPAVLAADAGQVTARWWRVNTASLPALSLADTGVAGGEEIAPGTFTFFPSVAVDSKGNMAIGFAATAPSIYPGAYFAMRLVGDPPGTTRPAGVLRAGLDFYVRDFTTSTTVPSRWGDYTGISIDPEDNSTFWVYNEYALTRGTVIPELPEEDGRWGTAFGSFAFACTLGCPADIVVPNDPGVCGARVTYPEPTSTGSCGNIATSHPSGSVFPVGTTTVTITGTRQDGSTDTCSFKVTVLDTTAPVIGNAYASPSTLWPPDGQMEWVTVSYGVTDNCAPPPSCQLSAISSEGSVPATIGNPTRDIQIIDAHRLLLRARRNEGGPGRFYFITISCRDREGNKSEKEVRVRVPRDQLFR